MPEADEGKTNDQSANPIQSLIDGLKEKGINPLFLLIPIPIVMLGGFCMCCGICSVFAPDAEEGSGGASVASTKDDDREEESSSDDATEESQPSLADGPIPFSTFEDHTIDLLSAKGGYDVSGTGLAALKNTGLRVTLGAIQYSFIETILVVIVHDKNDNVLMVQLNFSVNAERDFDKATATYSQAHEFLRNTIFPQESEEVREFISKEAANIQFGNGAEITLGKATLIAKARGNETLYKASLNLDDYMD